MEHFDIGSDDATSDGLLLLVPISLWLEALVARLHQHLDSLVGKHALDHGEPLVVLAT